MAQQVSVVTRIPVPSFRSVTPQELLTGAVQSVTVAADSLRADVQALITSPSGKSVAATVGQATSTQVVLELPPLDETGAYSLVLTNPPGQSRSVPAAFVVRHPPAVIASVEPQTLRTSQIPATLSVRGSNFEPGARLFLTGAERIASPIPLDVEAATPDSITARLPAGLDPGTYDLSLVNEPDGAPVYSPDRRLTILPPPVPTRKFLVSLAWMPELPLGDWGAIYGGTAAGAGLRADYFLTPHGTPSVGSALDFAVGVDGRVASFGQASSSAFIPSSLVGVALSIDPSVTWTLPFLSVTARAGGGLAYSRLDASGTSTSVDLAAVSELDMLVPVSDLFLLGVSATYRHLFLTHGMDLFGASTFVAFNF
jgi:hypothetical protein